MSVLRRGLSGHRRPPLTLHPQHVQAERQQGRGGGHGRLAGACNNLGTASVYQIEGIFPRGARLSPQPGPVIPSAAGSHSGPIPSAGGDGDSAVVLRLICSAPARPGSERENGASRLSLGARNRVVRRTAGYRHDRSPAREVAALAYTAIQAHLPAACLAAGVGRGLPP